jgi:hypothetical protein
MRPRLTGESAISSTQSVYYMTKVLLAVFVGLFRTRPITAEPGHSSTIIADTSPIAGDASPAVTERTI